MRSFNRVADQLPPEDWLAISAQWLDANQSLGIEKITPNILVDETYTRERNALAVSTRNGACIVFSPEVLSWDDGPLDALMAHELAHVFHLAEGTVIEDEADEEAQAVTTMQRWGFDDSLIDVYRIQTRFFPDAPEVIPLIRKTLGVQSQ